MNPSPPNTEAIARVERWFLSRGLPHLTAGYSASRDVLTDEAYRREFLEDVVCEVREAFAVRAVYLAALDRSRG